MLPLKMKTEEKHMNVLRKIMSAVSAAALAYTAAASVYAPAVSADEYIPQTEAAVISEEVYSSASSLDISELNASSKAEYTIMIYMVGSNLESQWGCATEDIKEICKGFTGSKVNIIIQTGGTYSWQHSSISARKCQRFKVTSSGIKLVDDSLGQQDMSSKNTLCSFIQYCKSKYSASHYGLILWDHGGGPIYGFGEDQNYGYSTMPLTDYQSALKKGGVHFDFVGFDACLMGSVETALLTSEYADYLICAEGNESGLGWYYTDWINALCKNPKLSVPSFGKTIADTCIKKSLAANKNSYDDISVIDLSAVRSKVMPALSSFAKSSISLLDAKKYHIIAKNRAAVTFYDEDFDLVDISEYASEFSGEKTVSKSASALKSAVKKAVVYRKAAGSAASQGGLSVAFPFDDLENLDIILDIYDKAGVNTAYTDFLEKFANIMAGGQQYHLNSTEMYNYSACDWYDEDQFYSDSYYAKFYLGEKDEDLKLRKVNGHWVFPITSDNSAIISRCELNMRSLNSSETAFTDYGSTNFCDVDSHGNIIVEYDQKWASLNGKPIPSYYLYSYTEGKTEKHVSATFGKYNGHYAAIYLLWNDSKQGTIMGWQPLDGSGPSRLVSCKSGDTFRIYYSKYSNSKWTDVLDDTVYKYGKTKVTYSSVSKLGKTAVFCEITDIFNNTYYTDVIFYE